MKTGDICFCFRESLFWKKNAEHFQALQSDDAVFFISYVEPRCYDEIKVLTKYGFGFMNLQDLHKK